MEVRKRISVDFNRPDSFLQVRAMQGDGFSRQVEMILLNDGAAWLPPKGAEPSIIFHHKKTGVKGFYDKLPDDSPAIAITGNIAIVTLVSAMLAEPGDVWVVLSFNDAELNRLTTFPFTLSVYPNPAVGSTEVEDYIRLQWLEDKFQELSSESTGKINEKLQEMDERIQAADAATKAANEAKSAAEEAARAALEKASAASQAAASAADAAAKAAQAVADANRAAAAASDAAKLAQEKATAAEQAAGNASASASRADTAAGNANTAADAANRAAAAANEAAQQLSPDVEQLKKDIDAILSGTKENARFHLGLYRDENGELCELEEE